jgi:hypothetical protein
MNDIIGSAIDGLLLQPTEPLVNETNEPIDADTEPTEPETELETTEPEPEPTEDEGYEEEELNHIATELFGGNVEEIAARLAELDELKSKQPTGELVFENDFQKAVYEYASKIPDITAEGASQLLAEVFFTNPEVADTKNLLALNYRIANPELTSEEAMVLFEDEFERKYPDLEELSPTERTRLGVEIRKAKENINTFKQSNFVKTAPKVDNVETEKAKAEQQRIAAEWLNTVKAETSKMDKLSFQLEGNETLNFQIPDKSVIAKRGETIETFLAEYQTDKGFESGRFLQDVAKLANFDNILKEAYNQGKQQGVIDKTKEIAGVKPQISTQPQSPVAPAPQSKEQMLDAIANAMAGVKS